MFFHELHVGDGHAAVHRFAHVVHGQQSHLYGGEGFHFHAGLAVRFHRGGATHARWALPHFKVQRHAGQGQRMAKRNQVAGFFGGLDAGDAGNANHVAFFGAATFNQRQGGGQHLDLASGHRNAVGGGLGANVHHVGLALGIKVGQGHGHSFSRVKQRWVTDVGAAS